MLALRSFLDGRGIRRVEKGSRWAGMTCEEPMEAFVLALETRVLFLEKVESVLGLHRSSLALESALASRLTVAAKAILLDGVCRCGAMVKSGWFIVTGLPKRSAFRLNSRDIPSYRASGISIWCVW